MATEDDTQGATPTENEAAEPKSAAASGIADTLKASFAEYIDTHEVVAPTGGQLNLDWDFLRNHGGPLVAHMFTSLTQQLLPENLSFSVPAPKATAKAEDGAAEAASADAPKPATQINFDLGDFLGKLFRPPQGGPKER